MPLTLSDNAEPCRDTMDFTQHLPGCFADTMLIIYEEPIEALAAAEATGTSCQGSTSKPQAGAETETQPSTKQVEVEHVQAREKPVLADSEPVHTKMEPGTDFTPTVEPDPATAAVEAATDSKKRPRREEWTVRCHAVILLEGSSYCRSKVRGLRCICV